MLCFDVALQAGLGHVDPRRMTWAKRATEAGLSETDPLRIEFERFAAKFDDIRRDPDQLMDASDVLWDAVKRSTWPRPLGRADVDG